MQKRIRIVHYAKGRKGQLSRARAQIAASKDFADNFLVLSSRVEEPWDDEWAPEIMAKWFVTAKTTVGRIWQEIKVGIWLAREERRGTFDLLHIHENTGLVVGAMWSALCNAPLIFDTHDLFSPQVSESNKWLRRLCSWFKWELLQGFIIKRAHCVLHVSPGILQIYRNKFPYGHHVLLWNLPSFLLSDKLQNNEIDSTSEQSSIVENHRGKPLRLIYFGLLSSERIRIDLIRAVASIPGVRLTLAGRLYEDIDDAKEYAEAFRQAVTDLQVDWRGSYTNSSLPGLLKDIDMLIHPIPRATMNNRLALPNKFFESCASGKAIFYSNVFEEIDKLAREHNLGISFDPHNLASISDVLIELAANRSRVELMKENARKLLTTGDWSPSAYRGVIKRIYESI